MNKDIVTASFRSILNEVLKVETEIAQDGKTAFGIGDFASVRELSISGESLRGFKEKIILLSKE